MRTWNLIFLAVGLGALALTVLHVGPGALYAGISRIGVGFAISCSVHGCVVLLDALVLAGCALDRPTPRDTLRVIRAGFVGHGINTATPMGNIGEVTKYSMLVDRIPPDEVTAALVLQNLISLGANVVFLVVVPAAAPTVLGLDRGTSILLYAVAGGFAVLGVLGVLLVRHGAGSLPFRMARRVGVRADRVERAEKFWHKVEDAARRRGRSRGRMAVLATLSMASRLGGAVEAWVILRHAGADLHPMVACLTLANGQMMAWLTAFVPFQAGTAEGAGWFLFRQLGLDPATGVLLELVKKGRRVVFFTIGMLVGGARFFRRAPPAPAAG